MKKTIILLTIAAVAALGANAAEQRMVRISGCPFEMPPIAEVTNPDRDFPVTDYGARPDGTKCTAAFAAAMAACEKAGGGRVVVPDGRWVTGAIRFRSNCTLYLAEGAVLVFTDDPADYPEVFTTWEGIECYNHSPLLYAFECSNVAITGKGLIAPKMDLWRDVWSYRPPSHMAATEQLYYWCSTNAPVASRRLLALKDSHMRPHLIQFNRCRNVLLDGFRIKESPFWMIHLYHSENCIVRNLETYAHGHNNDGVDVDMTRNVLIEGCRFDQGDDGIVLKAGRNADAWRLNRPTENVVIRNCDLVSSHSLLGIGSELSGGIRNVWMTGCRVSTTFNMLRIKTGRRRGGFVENVWLDHCTAKDVRSVFNLFTQYCAQWGAFPDFEIRYTRIRNINVSDCTCVRAKTGVLLEGDRHLPASEITIRNVKVGEVTEKMTEIVNCHGVRLDGLELGYPDPHLMLPSSIDVAKAAVWAERSPAYAKAVEFLRRADFKSLACGRHELGEGVVAEIRETSLVPLTERKDSIVDRGHDTIYRLVQGKEYMLCTGPQQDFHYAGGAMLFKIPAGLEYSPDRTNKRATDVRVCEVKIPSGAGRTR